MAAKHLVLEILEQNRDQHVSGEEIAGLLNLSRNMIWRAVQDLRGDGYVIESSTKKGYRLNDGNDILSIAGIKPFLASPGAAEHIKVHREIDSTNREAKAQAVNRAAHGTVIVSDCQTHGKGRCDRAFFSPPGSGLYMSFLLTANEMRFHHPTAITAYAALCVCEAIEAVCGVKLSIKWVNDIFLDGKKICGILTEAISEFESGALDAVIVGIGINISTKPEQFPPEFQACAGSLYPDGAPPVTRNRLAAEIINRMLSDPPGEEALFSRYKQRLFMLGSRITILQGQERHEALALDLDGAGRLIARLDHGGIKAFSSGEITIVT